MQKLDHLQIAFDAREEQRRGTVLQASLSHRLTLVAPYETYLIGGVSGSVCIFQQELRQLVIVAEYCMMQSRATSVSRLIDIRFLLKQNLDAFNVAITRCHEYRRVSELNKFIRMSEQKTKLGFFSYFIDRGDTGSIGKLLQNNIVELGLERLEEIHGVARGLLNILLLLLYELLLLLLGHFVSFCLIPIHLCTIDTPEIPANSRSFELRQQCCRC